MLLLILAVASCFVAALLQLAVLRSPDIIDKPGARNARKLTIVGLLVGAIYATYMLDSYGSASAPYCLALGLIAMGQIIFALNSLLEHLWTFNHHPVEARSDHHS